MSDYVIETTLVINERHGGFGLSQAAARELARRKGLTLYHPVEGEDFLFVEGGHDRIEHVVPRNDPDLIAVVREMGAAANGPSAELRVVTVPIHVDIECDDGREQLNVWGGSY